jgi:rhodanese-related sulfurtransferase
MQYAGDITSLQAWGFLSSDHNSILIDVRTSAEIAFVGRPNIPDNKYVASPIYEFPHMEFRDSFLEDIKLLSSYDKILFLCRSGSRSRNAAAIASNSGLNGCYNISDGFEGELDDNGHRGNISGWKANKLPWSQT